MANTRRSKDEVKQAALEYADRARRGEHGLPRDDTRAVEPDPNALVKPSIHLNGSSADYLHEGYVKALQALQAALVAVAETAPHGRDYYVQDGEAFKLATTQHAARLNKLEAVKNELQELARHVSREQRRRR